MMEIGKRRKLYTNLLAVLEKFNDQQSYKHHKACGGWRCQT